MTICLPFSVGLGVVIVSVQIMKARFFGAKIQCFFRSTHGIWQRAQSGRARDLRDLEGRNSHNAELMHLRAGERETIGTCAANREKPCYDSNSTNRKALQNASVQSRYPAMKHFAVHYPACFGNRDVRLSLCLYIFRYSVLDHYIQMRPIIERLSRRLALILGE